MTANIESISALGEMIVRFNASLNPDVNLTELDSSVFSLYIEPAELRHIYSEDFNLSSVNFTWHVTSFAPKELVFKLNFSEPLAISPLLEQDLLILHFKDLNYFYSAEVQNYLHKDFWTISRRIRKQNFDSALN